MLQNNFGPNEGPGNLICGIDEAGRGCVIGPLIIAAAVWKRTEYDQLASLGVRDSKEYTSEKEKKERISLADKIRSKAHKTCISEIPPREIDEAIHSFRTAKNLDPRAYAKENLNILEINRMAELIITNPCHVYYIDSLSKPKYFLKRLEKTMMALYSDRISGFSFEFESNIATITWLDAFSEQRSKIIAENKADAKFPVVSAASIIAKVYRDTQIRLIEEKYGLPRDILSTGYANDTLMPFLQQYRKEISKRVIFPFIRYEWRWRPLMDIISRQMSLLDF